MVAPVGESSTPIVPASDTGTLSKREGALVIGGDYRGLGIVRSLGRRGIPVWVALAGRRLAGHSRYAVGCASWPEGGAGEQVSWLLDFAARSQETNWTLIPTSDDTAALISGHVEALAPWYRLISPPTRAVEIGLDKRRTHDLAASLRIAHPRTWNLMDPLDIRKLDISFPVILKPAVKIGSNPLIRAKAWKARDIDSLRVLLDKAARAMPLSDIMLQELIPGDGHSQLSYAGVMGEGLPVGEVVACRLRQYPYEFGQHSTFVTSVDDTEVLETGRRVVAALRYSGPIEVEFKRDPRDGLLKILDLNVRVWGWHTLGTSHDIDFAFLMWQLAHGKTSMTVSVPPGLTWHRTLTDLPFALHLARHSPAQLPSYLASFLRSSTGAIYSTDDPLPALLELPTLGAQLLRAVRA